MSASFAVYCLMTLNVPLSSLGLFGDTRLKPAAGEESHWLCTILGSVIAVIAKSLRQSSLLDITAVG